MVLGLQIRLTHYSICFLNSTQLNITVLLLRYIGVQHEVYKQHLNLTIYMVIQYKFDCIVIKNLGFTKKNLNSDLNIENDAMI